MHAARLVRPIRTANRQFSRSLSAAATTTTRTHDTVIPLSNVEAQWEKLTADEQLTVHQQLEELQKRDWKTLSLDEKKAAYYIAFGPHGPRADLHPPGSVPKLIMAILVGVAAGGALYLTSRAFAGPPPKTMTKEWQEASNERARELNLDPITGVPSEGYSGKGFVQSK
ncbi:cytochrome c oxidase subunit IV [Thelephora ganbajun]|uniref:Cytochrome c oxidase subunit IV n=1 Tax=Thelephora ganbajun TaxID=370292 RepID=A0ACB6ZPD1_THEGA|nr:cytochrome c oxidase subunit IV [Thelephora ganbajun]